MAGCAITMVSIVETAPPAFVAVILTCDTAGVVGVPEITPFCNDNPVGRPVAVKVVGGLPLAVSAKLNGTATMPVASPGIEIAGGIALMVTFRLKAGA